MKTVSCWNLTTLTLCAALIAALAGGSEGGKDGLSPEVVATLKRAFPQKPILAVGEITEKGEQILRLRLGGPKQGLSTLAKVSPAGEIIELDEDLEQDEVPEHVQRAFRKAFPRGTIKHIEKGTRMEISYRMDIIQDGHKHEVRITRRGRIFEVVDRN